MCQLLIKAGSFTADGKAGANTTKFSGKLGRRKLKRGPYIATAVATDSAGGKSLARTTRFTIVKRRR